MEVVQNFTYPDGIIYSHTRLNREIDNRLTNANQCLGQNKPHERYTNQSTKPLYCPLQVINLVKANYHEITRDTLVDIYYCIYLLLRKGFIILEVTSQLYIKVDMNQ